MNVDNRKSDSSVLAESQVGTYQIVSRIGYLAGVEKHIFENPYEPLCLEVFQQMEEDRNARILRNLCMIRTKLEQNFGFINDAMRYGMKNLDSLPEYIPAESLRILESEGISLVRANRRTDHYVMDVNQHIANRISSCKNLFPEWLNWDYVRQLFIMPKGTTEQGVRQAGATYYARKHLLPYQIYLNWTAPENGNILYNDRKFVTLLYSQHGECFQNFSRVTDAKEETKEEIYQFLESGKRMIMVVDCENADPYKFYGMLDSLNREALLGQVSKLILYNDIHASTAWEMLSRFTELPVEHRMTKRIKENKSLVDPHLIAGVCREHYENGVDSVMLISSDSDYWALISSMPQIRFFVVVEQEKCSSATKKALEEAEVPYCVMDSFCTSGSSEIVNHVLLKEVRQALAAALKIDMRAVVEQACQAARVELTSAEKQSFYDRCIRTAHIGFGTGGTPIISVGS